MPRPPGRGFLVSGKVCATSDGNGQVSQALFHSSGNTRTGVDKPRLNAIQEAPPSNTMDLLLLGLELGVADNALIPERG